MNVYGVILAGGSGERFWPVSHEGCPKPFVDIFGGKTLIRHAFERLHGVIKPENTLVITAKRYTALVRKSLPELPKKNVLGEPCRRDTAAAVALATGLVRKRGGDDAVVCILTADHLMSPEESFRKALSAAIARAQEATEIVTIGIEPTRPETGFGYLDPLKKRFVEKPDLKTAKRYVKSGRFLWNSGMFVFRVRTMAEALSAHAPDFLPLVRKPTTAIYPSLPKISIDYAVMEKIANLGVVRGSFRWNDVGTWDALSSILGSDSCGNTFLGASSCLDVKDSIIVSDGSAPTVVIGLKDVVVVHTSRGTLVCAKDRVQDIKKLPNR